MLGLLLPNSLRYSQYAFKYSQILEGHGIEHEFIFWNRDGVDCSLPNAIYFEKQMSDFLPLRKKAPLLLSYASFVNRTVRERGYSGLIVFTSQMATMLMPLLLGEYKGRYIFDYRDVSRENFLPYKTAVKKIASHACFTAVSSPAFKDVIGAECSTFVISHNERDICCEDVVRPTPTDYGPIRVVFWGTIRQPSFNKLVCRRFGSDERFSLTYHGTGCTEELENYCKENGFSNIRFTGVYDEGNIETFAHTTDLLLNAYENDVVQKTAYTVKYYDGLRYGIPSIVTMGSAMAESVASNHLGIVVDWNDPLCTNGIYEAYRAFDWSLYMSCRSEEIRGIKADDERFESMVTDFSTAVMG